MSSLWEKAIAYKKPITFDDVIEEELTKAISDLYYAMKYAEAQERYVDHELVKTVRDNITRVRFALASRVRELEKSEKEGQDGK